MDMDKLRITISFRLPTPQYIALAELAEHEDTNVSDMTRRVVELGLATVGRDGGDARERVPA